MQQERQEGSGKGAILGPVPGSSSDFSMSTPSMSSCIPVRVMGVLVEIIRVS